MELAEVVQEDVNEVTDATEAEETLEPQAEPSVAEASPAEGADDDGEIVVSIAGESPSPEDEEADRAPTWVRELRKSNREKERRIRELEQRLSQQQPQEAAVVVGAKPTLEACDYDADKFAEQLEAWHSRKREAEAQEQRRKDAEAQAAQAWNARLQDYGQKAASLKVKDFADAEEMVRDVLNVTQQGVIVSGAENPALVVYALGKSPSKARELAAIQDPVKFAFAVAKLETQLKVQPRKVAPAPEKVVRAAGAGGGALENTLERLRAEAAKTGDMSKVMAYRRQQREAARSK